MVFSRLFSHDRASRKREKTRFLFFFPRGRHDFASARGTVMPLGKEKTLFFRERHSFASARGTVFQSQEARLGKGKKCFLLFFFRERHGFASAEGTVVPLGKEKTRFLLSFFSMRHDFAIARGMAVPLGKGKNVFSVSLFSVRDTVLLSREAGFRYRERHEKTSGFFMKKKLSKPINMEDLDARTK